jgi:thioredoxin reductase/Pyruvate/2-oxoacid:ferredoxin oxidoreductase delta subunit
MSSLVFVYLLPMTAMVGCYVLLKHRTTTRNLRQQDAARVDGMHEPASLHPHIDHSICLGCGSCVTACPEQSVMGLIRRKAELITAANCIGHGACRTACPVSAITLVFGTESRGVEIPHVNPDFQTNVEGIYIAGELGGMGLVRNAIEQGKQAVGSVVRSLNGSAGQDLDLLIVGAGPAGIASSLAAKEAKLNFVTIDQDSLGGTVAHFPRKKLVMTQPVQLPLVGKVNFRETSKESLLAFWQGVVDDQKIDIQFGRRLENIRQVSGGFAVKTTKGNYSASKVLLCLGRRGTPRRLGVPGEESTKVVYRLQDAEQYIGQKVLVVGGGDSAIEAAVAVAEQPGTFVTLAYRGKSFSRVKPKNRALVEEAAATGVLGVRLEAEVSQISDSSLVLESRGKSVELENDAIIVCAGGIMPKKILEEIGIQFEVKYGTS